MCIQIPVLILRININWYWFFDCNRDLDWLTVRVTFGLLHYVRVFHHSIHTNNTLCHIIAIFILVFLILHVYDYIHNLSCLNSIIIIYYIVHCTWTFKFCYVQTWWEGNFFFFRYNDFRALWVKYIKSMECGWDY